MRSVLSSVDALFVRKHPLADGWRVQLLAFSKRDTTLSNCLSSTGPTKSIGERF
jgi:hypothetical protein